MDKIGTIIGMDNYIVAGNFARLIDHRMPVYRINSNGGLLYFG